MLSYPGSHIKYVDLKTEVTNLWKAKKGFCDIPLWLEIPIDLPRYLQMIELPLYLTSKYCFTYNYINFKKIFGYLLLCNVLLFCFCIHRSWLEHGFIVPVLLYIVYVCYTEET